MQLLEQLTQIPSVPGREDRVRKFIESYITTAGLFDELTLAAAAALSKTSGATAHGARNELLVNSGLRHVNPTKYPNETLA